MEVTFGRLKPTPEKEADNNRYQLRSLNLEAPLSVEKIFAYPDYVTHYDQGLTGACTGFSSSWMMSIYNGPKYDAKWLWRRGKETDGDAGTRPNNDNDGGYIWAVMDVLRKEGHRKVENGVAQPADIKEGIQSYYWCKNITDLRTAFDQNRPAVFGINWYEEFQNPRTINGRFWIGSRTKWGGILGGHAICCIGCSDNLEGALLLNSWGSYYPNVWISYRSIERLLSEQGEIAVALDYIPDVPPPPPPPVEKDKIDVTFKFDGNKYSGSLYRTN